MGAEPTDCISARGDRRQNRRRFFTRLFELENLSPNRKCAGDVKGSIVADYRTAASRIFDKNFCCFVWPVSDHAGRVLALKAKALMNAAPNTRSSGKVKCTLLKCFPNVRSVRGSEHEAEIFAFLKTAGLRGSAFVS